MIQSAHAILLYRGGYVLQLRDNLRTISAAGQWSLFGGRVEEGEAPAATVLREVREELSIMPPAYRFLWSSYHFAKFEQAMICMWFFETCVDEVWGVHRLTEGQAVKVFTFEELDGLNMPPVMRKVLRRYHRTRQEG